MFKILGVIGLPIFLLFVVLAGLYLSSKMVITRQVKVMRKSIATKREIQ